mgnify:CR=1 FL=1
MEKKLLFIALIILIIILVNYFSKEEIIGKKIQNIQDTKISCKNKCFSDGIKQCSGKGYIICKDYNKDGCLEWGNVNSCNNGECIKELESLSDIPSYSYYKGWNLISLPVYILNPDKSIIFH